MQQVHKQQAQVMTTGCTAPNLTLVKPASPSTARQYREYTTADKVKFVFLRLEGNFGYLWKGQHKTDDGRDAMLGQWAMVVEDLAMQEIGAALTVCAKQKTKIPLPCEFRTWALDYRRTQAAKVTQRKLQVMRSSPAVADKHIVHLYKILGARRLLEPLTTTLVGEGEKVSHAHAGFAATG